MNEEITLDAIEKLLWDVTKYQIDQAQADSFRVLIEAHALQLSSLWKKAPTEVIEAHLATLITLARQLLDTGGRMRLDPAGQLDVADNPVATRRDMEALGRKVVSLADTVKALQAAPAKDDSDLAGRLSDLRAMVAELTSKTIVLDDPAPKAFTDREGRVAAGQFPRFPGELEQPLLQWEAELLAGQLPTVEQERAAGRLPAAEVPAADAYDQPLLDEPTREQVRAALPGPKPKSELNADGTLTCSSCGIPKSTTAYFRNSKSRLGFETKCRDCRSAKAA
jgi:hypothetical protein